MAKTNLRKTHKEIQNMQSLEDLTVFTPVLCPACFTMGVQEERKDGSIKNNRSLGSWPTELNSKIKQKQTTKEPRCGLARKN